VESTYLLAVKSIVVEPVGPVDDVNVSAAVPDKISVGSLIHLFDLVAAERKGLNRPIAVL
jgi:hypothetical protein